MIFLVALITAVLFGVFVFALLSLRQGPEAQLRKRLNEMIDKAEADRALHPKQRKNVTPTVVAMPKIVEQQFSRKTALIKRVFQPIINSIDERLQRLTPAEIRLQLEDKIFRAGKLGVWGLRRVITIWCASIAVATVIAIALIYNSDIHPLQRVMTILIGAFVGAAIPFAVLNSTVRNRQKALRKQLPEFLDILCVSVQAGLSFDGAVAKMVRRMHGPLIDEFKRMQNDIALGMTHQYALTNMARRCDLEEIYLFTTSVIQAEKLGTSMTRTLKQQADNIRDRHRQHVKGEALKAPVKMIFPMVLFIFPSMFVVLLFPAVLSLIRNLNFGQ